MRLVALSLLLVLGPVAGAWAEDSTEPRVLSDAEAVEAVRRAHADSDAAALLALAKADRPDPWVVAEILWATDHLEAALAFAKAAPRPDTERLAAHVASLRGMPVPKDAIDALSQAGAAHGVDDGAKALALLEGLDFGAARVHAARARFLAGMARRATAKRGDMAAHKAARDFFHATLEVAQDLGWWAFAARATFEEARSAFKVNDLEGARRALEREAGIQERRGNLLGVSEALGSIGHYIHRRAGRFAEARDVFERALDFAQRAGDAQQARWSRRALASACARLGDFDRAMALYDELQVHADAHGRPEDRAELRIKRAGILRLQGDLATALELVERASALYLAIEPQSPKRKKEHKGWLASAAGMRATLLQELGQYEKALPVMSEALALRRALGEDHSTAIVLGNLGNLHVDRKAHDEARKAYGEARILYERAGDQAGLAAVLEGLGSVEHHAGKHEAAHALRRQALEHARASGARDRIHSASLALARSYLPLGRFEEGLALVESTLKEAVAEGYWRLEMMARMDAAEFNLRMARHAEALGHVDAATQRIASVAGGLAAEEGVTLHRPYLPLYRQGIEAARALTETEALFRILERHHTGKLLAAIEAQRGPAAQVPDALLTVRAAAYREVVAARAQLERAAARRTRAAMREARGALRAVEGRWLRAAQRVLRARRAEAAPARSPATSEAVRRVLAPDEVLVAYFNPLWTAGARSRHSFALVLTREALRLVPLPSREAIDTAVRATTPGDPEVDPGAALGRLAALVIEPLALPASKRRLVVAPHGLLALVPFALLAPQREVAYVPSASVLHALRTRPARPADGVLALGDPTYGPARGRATGAVRSATLARLVALPGTREEVQRVGSVKLLGAEASEAGLAAALASRARWRALHFACHGLVDTERPLFSALALSRDETNDGFLCSLEILDLRLDVELVATSACETGAGKAYENDGILGLTRTFLIAGAPRVLCSLWPVDDEASRALMIRFYELWNPQEGTGSSAAAALKQAQAHVRDHVDAKGERPWAHPYYWAAWVLWGLPE